MEETKNHCSLLQEKLNTNQSAFENENSNQESTATSVKTCMRIKNKDETTNSCDECRRCF